MGCEQKKRTTSLSNLSVVKKSKGNIFNKKPVFCDNGNAIIICYDSSLHMYSTSTGELVKEILKCSEKVISYHLHPLDASKLIVITENGEVIVCNLKTNEIKYSVKLKLKQKFLKRQKAPFFCENAEEIYNWETQPLDSLDHRKFLHAEVKAFQNNPTRLLVWTSWCLNSENQAHLSVFVFNNGKHIKYFNAQQSGLQNCSSNFVVGTSEGYEVFVGMCNQYVHVSRYDAQHCGFSIMHFIESNTEITCLALHPTECSFALGDSEGKIIIWKNIFDKQPLKNVLHWHALPVRDIFFSKFGNYLFSGGEENVLVKWSINSYKKDFLPRLSSNIHQISGACEQSLLAISMMDNKILILDFNFNKISTMQHFSAWCTSKVKNKFKVFTVDSRSDCLVLNGKTGHIQFLSLKEDCKFLYTFDVTNKTLISNGNFEIQNIEVTHAKFSRDGKWLITAECREENICKESRLKFWMFCKKQNSFKLNTNVEFPHDEFELNSLEISLDETVATSGGDRKFRLWSHFEHEQAKKSQGFWAVHSINKYRNFPCFAIDFSRDASLIAVTFGPILTVWETNSCVLKCALSVPDRKDELRFCKFGNYELSHLVVTASKSVISCWNLITLSITWTVPLELSLLISDPFSIFMAAFSDHGGLIIFNPSSPAPDLVLDRVSDSPVMAAHCVLNESGKFCLYFLTSDQQLFCLDDADKVQESISGDEVHTFSTPYSLQLAEKQNPAEFDKRKTVLLNKNNRQSVTGLLDSPAHTLPNPSMLCLDVLKGLLVFSENQSTGASTGKEVTQSAVIKRNETPEDIARVGSDEFEKKMLNIVKTIFV